MDSETSDAPLQRSSSADSSTDDRKRQVHLKCEQQRREAIKQGYEELKGLLPAELAPQGCKLTNASILFRAADYIESMEDLEHDQKTELSKMKAQVIGLELIARNYEQLSSREESASSSSDLSLVELKFKMFQKLMDFWFDTFKDKVKTDNYPNLVDSFIKWIESSSSDPDFPELINQVLGDIGSPQEIMLQHH